jgi:hypothetical protein
VEREQAARKNSLQRQADQAELRPLENQNTRNHNSGNYDQNLQDEISAKRALLNDGH